MGCGGDGVFHGRACSKTAVGEGQEGRAPLTFREQLVKVIILRICSVPV